MSTILQTCPPPRNPEHPPPSRRLAEQWSQDLHRQLGIRVLALVGVTQSEQRLDRRPLVCTCREASLRHASEDILGLLLELERQTHGQGLRILADAFFDVVLRLCNALEDITFLEDLAAGTAFKFGLAVSEVALRAPPAGTSQVVPTEGGLVLFRRWANSCSLATAAESAAQPTPACSWPSGSGRRRRRSRRSRSLSLLPALGDGVEPIRAA
mmetsp:Transcript_26458/g.87765  ORF Transcript_26458/g.87765 Transcript_26458/m.87765 type:complete len:212 (-) Transcript_26458:307-942(-)